MKANQNYFFKYILNSVHKISLLKNIFFVSPNGPLIIVQFDFSQNSKIKVKIDNEVTIAFYFKLDILNNHKKLTIKIKLNIV